MTAPILVTGGTGALGRLVVPRLRDTGSNVRVLSRSARERELGIEFVAADLATGEGVDAAVEGVETIVHLAGSAKGDEVKAQRLVEAASRVGVRHIVYISVVGADRIPVTSAIDRMMFGYFASKRAAEQIIADSGIPWTTLRATQFHTLTLTTAEQMAKLPVVPVPSGFKFQPIDPAEVADRLVELALRPPAGFVPEMAGAKIYEMSELVRSYLRASGKRRLLMPVRMPGNAAAAFRAGANLDPERAVGRRTWEEFLTEHVGAPSDREFVPVQQ